MSEPKYSIEFRPLPSDVPVEIRLRQLMKVASRLKCVDYWEISRGVTAVPARACAPHSEPTNPKNRHNSTRTAPVRSGVRP
jgi:hypothetical protein